MTATDELRELLTAAGAEWNGTVGANGTVWTHWDTFNGYRVHAMDNDDGTLWLFNCWDLTPEQAIAVTLGQGTCQADETERISTSWKDGRHVTIHVMECSECGHTYEHVNGPYEFCPRCGRKVVEVDA